MLDESIKIQWTSIISRTKRELTDLFSCAKVSDNCTLPFKITRAQEDLRDLQQFIIHRH